MKRGLFLLIIVAILLAACSPAQPLITNTEPAAAPAVPTASPYPTFTPPPPLPTYTPYPTYTPVLPTSTPSFELFTTDQVVAVLKTANLEVESPTAMEPKDYGMAPMTATSGIHFLVPSVCPDCGGRIMSFANSSDRDAVKAYYDALGKSSAAFFSWVFIRENILIQINGELPKAKADLYQAALDNMKP